MAFQTRSANWAFTVGMRFTVRETVAIETPARAATSRMLITAGRRRSATLRLGSDISDKFYAFLAVSQRDFSRINSEPRADDTHFQWLWRIPGWGREHKKIEFLGQKLLQSGKRLLHPSFGRTLLLRMILASSGHLERMAQERHYGGETLLCSSLAAGQVEDEHGATKPGDSS